MKLLIARNASAAKATDPWTAAVTWLRRHDGNLAVTRRAARAAIIMPAMFAIGDKIIDNPAVATFAAFGSFAMLLFVDFGGPMRARIQAQLCLIIAAGVLICLGTLASRSTWLATVVMAAVGFVVLFSGIVSSVLASSSTALLLALILPVTQPGPVSSIPDRLAGWGMAGGASLIAITLLWPAPVRDALRGPAVAACRGLAGRLRAEVAHVLGVGSADQLTEAVGRSDAAVTALQRGFYATPYRPTGLSTTGRIVVRLVDELGWLHAVLAQSPVLAPGVMANRSACAVKTAAAEVLETGAALLDDPSIGFAALQAALGELLRARLELERTAAAELPVGHGAGPEDQEFLDALDPGFRAQELGFAVATVASNIDLTAAAERRGWLERLLGRQPAGAGSALATTQQRASAHLERHSVWLHNTVRGAAGLALATLVAEQSGVQHAFWVILGTLSVLRSSALNTGQNVLRGIAGTLVGFVVGGLLVAAIGTDPTVLWILLPVAILFAGLAPAAISFAAGQAGFTVTLLILFNIIEPTGWRVGLVRIEDVALGGVVSLVVGLLFWPRGAASSFGQALAEAYAASAGYLRAAVAFGVSRCDASVATTGHPGGEAATAAAAARRLDDAFRGYLVERGAKPLLLADITTLVTGVAGLRLAADAVLELWSADTATQSGERAAARAELSDAGELIARWYESLGAALAGGGAVPDALPHDKVADGRLVAAVRRDLRGEDGQASAAAVRTIWTGDHLQVARRLQGALVDPARAAVAQRSRSVLADALRRHPIPGRAEPSWLAHVHRQGAALR
jgi:hypothetical protein